MVETVASYGNVHMQHADSVFWVFVGGRWHIGGRGCHSKKCTVSIRLLREESHLVGRQNYQHTCRTGTRVTSTPIQTATSWTAWIWRHVAWNANMCLPILCWKCRQRSHVLPALRLDGKHLGTMDWSDFWHGISNTKRRLCVHVVVCCLFWQRGSICQHCWQGVSLYHGSLMSRTPYIFNLHLQGAIESWTLARSIDC